MKIASKKVRKSGARKISRKSAARKIRKKDVGPRESIRLPADEDRVRSTVADAAAEILNPVHSWIPDFLSDWSFEIVLAHSIEGIWPTRVQMRDDLIETWRLADHLDKHLQKSTTTGFITVHSDVKSSELFSRIASDLQELRSRIRQTLNAPELVDKAGKLLRGRSKPLLPNTQPPKYRCAAIIVEVVDFFYPDGSLRPTQRRILSAADKLWKAWFKPDGWGDDGVTGWKGYFQAADEPRLQSFRAEVRRALRSLAHYHAQLAE